MTATPPPSDSQRRPSWWARVRQLSWKAFIVGPDPPSAYGQADGLAVLPASRWDTLLTWPARLLAVAGAALVGVIWKSSPPGIQLGWALHYGLLAAVAIVTSFWKLILGFNLVVAGTWVALARVVRDEASARGEGWRTSDVVTWANRQVEHVEVLAVWVAVALASSHALGCQLPFLAAVLALGAPIINWLARTRLFGGDKAAESREALIIERRAVIYVATLLGLLSLALQAWRQLWTIVPLLAAVLPGVALRFVRHFRRRRLDHDQRGYRLQKANLQLKAGRFTGWIGPVLVAGFFGAAAGVSHWERGNLAREANADRDGRPPPIDACGLEPGGPAKPTLAMLILADTQIHELGGSPFPGQMEVADTLVPVARRPVELDMLSTAAIVRFQTVYEELAKQRQNAGLAPPLWAHLGDFADLSCTGEMKRMLELLEKYGADEHGKERRLLAGFAPGNHDSAFTGNFAWSPFWDQACSTKPMGKEDSDDQLGAFLTPGPNQSRLVPAAITKPVDGWWAPEAIGNARLARYTVSPLGVVAHEPGAAEIDHGVIGIFLDTSDRNVRDFGVAGLYGTFSERQEKAILEAVQQLASGGGAPGATGPWAEPWFVLFGHIPYDELTPGSRATLDDLIQKLDGRHDGCKPDEASCHRARVLALLTAHTHVAGSHRHCVGRRLVREIVVGSVIDPPEQAAVMEIGRDARGRGSLRVTTLPSVARPGMTCPGGAMVDAGVCHRTMAELAAAPECQELVAGAASGAEPGADCESLERPLTTDEQVAGIVHGAGPQDLDDLEVDQNKRARALLHCACRPVPATSPSVKAELPKGCPGPEPPLEKEAYAKTIEALARDPRRQEEMTCLAWAASAVQRHKAAGMTMAGAIRCAFDDPSLEAAQVNVAVAEDVPCQ
jgi:hypothetical protein